MEGFEKMKHLTSRDEVADEFWKGLCDCRERPLLDALMDSIDTSMYREKAPDVRQTKEFLAKFAEHAWKSGFADAMWAVRTGHLIIPADDEGKRVNQDN